MTLYSHVELYKLSCEQYYDYQFISLVKLRCFIHKPRYTSAHIARFVSDSWAFLLSVSVTIRYCVQTAQLIVELFELFATC